MCLSHIIFRYVNNSVQDGKTSLTLIHCSLIIQLSISILANKKIMLSLIEFHKLHTILVKVV